jgi:hypothetical protein
VRHCPPSCPRPRTRRPSETRTPTTRCPCSQAGAPPAGPPARETRRSGTAPNRRASGSHRNFNHINHNPERASRARRRRRGHRAARRLPHNRKEVTREQHTRSNQRQRNVRCRKEVTHSAGVQQGDRQRMQEPSPDRGLTRHTLAPPAGLWVRRLAPFRSPPGRGPGTTADSNPAEQGATPWRPANQPRTRVRATEKDSTVVQHTQNG